MSLLLKIPCIIVTTLALHFTFTPPSRAPADSKQPPQTISNRYLLWTVFYLPLVKAPFWTIAAFEILTIVRHLLDLSAAARAANLGITHASMLGALLIIAGALLRVQCYRSLQKFFTFEFTIQKDHKLVTSGPYSIVRHPSYSGMVLVDVGLVFWHAFPGSFLRESGILHLTIAKVVVGVLALGYFGIGASLLDRAREEDVQLESTFGNDWRDWAKRVPYRVVPGVY